MIIIYLATGYFHKGYEVPMLAAAALSEFDKVLIGNGAEGSTLYGVHKPARLFIQNKKGCEETTLTLPEAAPAYAELKKESVSLESLAQWGESALKGKPGPAATIIACQAGTLCHLLGLRPTFQKAFDDAKEALQRGTLYDSLMRYLDQS